MKKGFIILLDALRHDYVTAATTPFLYGLKSKSSSATVIETFAFQTRPAYFAGLTPDQSKICHLFEYNREFSPFFFLAPFNSVLKSIDPWGSFKFGRGILKRVAKLIERTRGFHASADVMSSHEVPLHLLPNFAFAEREYTDTPDVFCNFATIFDLLRNAGLSYQWIGYPKHFGSTASILSTFEKLPKRDVTYLHFSELDWIGHKFGPNSQEIQEALKAMDLTLRELLTPHIERGCKVAIFGDHGMVQVTHQIDIISALKPLSAKLGSDYVTFIDSTQARFWFKSPNARDEVTRALESIAGGTFLSPDERRALGVWECREKFGHEIFALDGSGIIHPSFFEHRSPPKGMHGYLPHVEDNKTQVFAYANGTSQNLGTIPMAQIFQLLREWLSI